MVREVSVPLLDGKLRPDTHDHQHLVRYIVNIAHQLAWPCTAMENANVSASSAVDGLVNGASNGINDTRVRSIIAMPLDVSVIILF